MGLSDTRENAKDTGTTEDRSAKRTLPESHQHSEHIPDMAMPERPAHDQSLPAMHDLPIEVPQRVRERVLDILAEELTDQRWLDLLNEKPVEEWSLVHDLRMDSLDWCCFCLRLEEEFDMNRDIADGSDPQTVGDFIRLVEAHLSGE